MSYDIKVNDYLVIKVPDEVAEVAKNDPLSDEREMIKSLESCVQQLRAKPQEINKIVCNLPAHSKDKVKSTIKRLENYPTDISCFNTIEESEAATNLKNRFIAILKEELL